VPKKAHAQNEQRNLDIEHLGDKEIIFLEINIETECLDTKSDKACRAPALPSSQSPFSFSLPPAKYCFPTV